MRSLRATFPSKSHAEAAVSALKEAGIAVDDIALSEADENHALVASLIEDGQVDAASAILGQSGSVDVDESLANRDVDVAGPSIGNAEVGPRSYRREDDPSNSTLLPPLPK